MGGNIYQITIKQKKKLLKSQRHNSANDLKTLDEVDFIL